MFYDADPVTAICLVLLLAAAGQGRVQPAQAPLQLERRYVGNSHSVKCKESIFFSPQFKPTSRFDQVNSELKATF